VVVGHGRDCDGDRTTHHRETLGTSDSMRWFAASAASEPPVGAEKQ
jgi:hypothetical protein